MQAITPSPPDPHATLNDEQRQATTHGRPINGGGVDASALLVIAGAGTGKTTTLAHRVAHLVVSGVPPERILLLTFTRRAAEEMTRRATELVATTLKASQRDDRVRFPWAGTFHSVANRLLRRYAGNLGLAPGFSVLDRGDAADLLDLLRQEHGYGERGRRFPRKDVCLAIYSARVNTQQPLDDVLRASFPWCVEHAAALTDLFRRYVERKLELAVLDYDDLLLYWYHLSREPELAADLGASFDHVLVDEYQDTNTLQADILLAMKPEGRGVTVVGDDAQSIYAFRGAAVENILRFPDLFVPSARIVSLRQNYRSTQPVLDCANTVINESAQQYQKDLFSLRRGSEKPRYVRVEDPDAEVEYVIADILEQREQNVPLRRQAVLFRNAHHSDRLEVELTRRNIPYVKYGGLKFLEAAHIKDLLAILKWADNPKNEIAALRTLKLLPGMGPANARRCLIHFAAEESRLTRLGAFKPPKAAAERWPEFAALMATLSAPPEDGGPWHDGIRAARLWYQPFLEERFEAVPQRAADLEHLEHIATRFPTRERFLTELTLDPPAASGDLAGDPHRDDDYLILSTVHSAKGQEWDNVFVLNVTDGNFPSEFAAGQADELEEERRLLYVAITRARDRLHLMAPLKFPVTQQPRYGDRHVYGAKSRFMTAPVAATLDETFFANPAAELASAAKADVRVDVARSLRDMW
ncbi:MAG: ATP-dependent helicase [Pseudomonadota bacterium]